MQLYVTAFCARAGKTLVTEDSFLEMIAGRHFFESDEELYLRFRFAQVPEAFVKMMDLGYSAPMLRSKILEVRQELKVRQLITAARRKPGLVSMVMHQYLAALIAAQLRCWNQGQPELVPAGTVS